MTLSTPGTRGSSLLRANPTDTRVSVPAVFGVKAVIVGATSPIAWPWPSGIGMCVSAPLASATYTFTGPSTFWKIQRVARMRVLSVR